LKSDKPRLVVILGPTSIGKSGVAIEISKRVKAEIISADSLQVYRLLDIGTAKPTREDQKIVTHHLIDIVDPHEEFNAGLFKKHADSVILKLSRHHTRSIVVGGTYLYVRVLLHGLIQGVANNKQIRDRLRILKSSFGVPYVYDKLRSLDPEAASRIHLNDYVRIERALESYFISGKRISYLQKEHGFKNIEYNYLKIGLYDKIENLKRRIEERVDSMVAKGVVEEVEKIRKMGFSPLLKPLQAIGYRQINQYLEKEISLQRAIDLIKRDTRRLANRQMTWLRKDKEINWYKIPFDTNAIITEVNKFYS
jgi:tRNA dimethylallyltransferase